MFACSDIESESVAEIVKQHSPTDSAVSTMQIEQSHGRLQQHETVNITNVSYSCPRIYYKTKDTVFICKTTEKIIGRNMFSGKEERIYFKKEFF